MLPVTLRDFTVDATGRVPPGAVSVRVVNRGERPHRVSILALDGPDALQSFFAALRRDEPLPKEVRPVAETPTVPPGGELSVAVLLPPGDYLVLCPLRADGVPHVLRGMVRPLRVEEDAGARGEADAPGGQVR